MRALALAFALAAGGAACGYRVVRDGRVNVRAAERIQRGIAELRGIAFDRPVEIDVKRPDELREHLRELLDRDYSKEDLRDLARVHAALGLLPPDFDLRAALLHLYTAQVAGFYDPRTERLHLVDPPQATSGPMIEALQFVLRRDLVDEMLLAHELTHALQDQASDAIAASDDREDDATLAGFAYTLGGLREGALLELVERLGAIPDELASVLPDTPPVLRDSLVFQYSQGARFVAWAYLRGGWKAVDALLHHPPSSTEQVLWPNRFFVDLDEPTRVGVGGIEDYRGRPDWRALEENTLGELTIGIQLRGVLPAERAEWAARGWDGDRYAAFAEGDVVHLYWMSVWDSDRDAREFFDAERELLGTRFGIVEATTKRDLAASAGASPWHVERRENRVLVAIGVRAAELDARRERIWSESSFAVERREVDLDLGRAG